MAVEPWTFAAFVVSVASTITAGAAIGTFRYARELHNSVQEHERVLFGKESVESDQGIVRMVYSHRGVLRREDLISDGGERRG